jgi:hypothetical protein
VPRTHPACTGTGHRAVGRLGCLKVRSRVVRVGTAPRGISVSLNEFVDSFGTAPYRSAHTSTKAHPAKAGAAKPRVLAALATPSIDAT